ncbi:MAG: ABC transporter permease [Bacteroidales bacterium]|jgi:ABC-2 type transport system permease protein|nr:ABC transporter permease [Bacteroidales bacterium]
MRRLLSSIYKEFLVLIRDRAGLAILFIMPLVLILIMTVIQDATFKTVKEVDISMILVNNDKDNLGEAISKGLYSSNFFKIVEEIDGVKITEELAEELVAKGEYKIGIIIPERATEAIRGNVNALINKSFKSFNIPGVKKRTKKSTIDVTIYIDPVTSPSFRNMVMSSLKEFTSQLEIEMFFKNFSEALTQLMPDQKPIKFESFETIKYQEINASTTGVTKLPNSVQHNVPAWTMFAMFFIVLPMAGNIIKEREDGSAFRLKTMPGSFVTVMFSKIFVFLGVAFLQFILMLLVGVYIMPLLGLPQLEIGPHKIALAVMALASGLAATGYGVAIGTIATTHEQAATFGAVSIIIFAALGGIWVPVYIMPPAMRILSQFSPLQWGLNGFYDILLRGGDLFVVLAETGKLLFFFILMLIIAIVYNNYNKTK